MKNVKIILFLVVIVIVLAAVAFFVFYPHTLPNALRSFIYTSNFSVWMRNDEGWFQIFLTMFNAPREGVGIYQKDDAFGSYVQIGDTRIRVEVMDTDASRERGLSGRESIGEKEGMLFIFPEKGMYGFWMKDMKFPIDIVWISDDKIVGFEENVDPQIGARTSELKIYYPPEPVEKVLELSGGNFISLGGKVGDSIF